MRGNIVKAKSSGIYKGHYWAKVRGNGMYVCITSECKAMADTKKGLFKLISKTVSREVRENRFNRGWGHDERDE